MQHLFHKFKLMIPTIEVKGNAQARCVKEYCCVTNPNSTFRPYMEDSNNDRHIRIPMY